MKKLLLLSTIFASAFSIDSYAASAKKTISLDTVTVVATRTERDVQDVPGMVSVVSTKSASARTSSKVSDLLSDVPGLEFSGGPLRSGETINMRGFDSTSILITLDGRRQNFESQHDGQFYIDPSLLKRVEVVKGPSSASYGSGAIGGVVAFTTKDAADFLEPGETEGMQSSVGFQTANQEFNTTHTGYKVGNNYDSLASVTYRTTDDVELNNDTKQRSDDNIYTGLAKFSYDVSDISKLRVDLNSFLNNAKENSNPQEPGSATFAGKNLVDKQILSNQIGVGYEYDPESNKIDLSTKVYYTKTNVEEQILQATSLNPARDVLDREMQTIGFNLDNKSVFESPEFTDNLVSYGLELYHNIQEGKDTDSDSDSGVAGGGRAGVPNASSTIAGLYVQDELNFALKNDMELIVVPALRFDHYENNPDSVTLPDDKESALSPKLATTLKLNKNYNIFGSYAEAFRAPNLTELYATGTHFPLGGGLINDFASNPNLKPEETKTFEFGAGAEYEQLFRNDDSARFKLSRYITEATNYIDQVISINFVDGGTTSFVNVPKANIWGYEAEASYDNNDWEMKLGASYVSGENANTGAFIATKQPLIVTSSIGYKFDSINTTIGYRGKYVDDNKKALVDNTDPTNPIDYRRPGFATHGIYATYTPKKLKDLSFDVGVDNIFDKKYRQPFTEIYDFERNLKLKVTYKW